MRSNILIILACVLLLIAGCNLSANSDRGFNAALTEDPQPKITRSSSCSPIELIPSKSTQEINYEIYIGLKFFPLPNGMKYIGGYLITQKQNFSVDLIWYNEVYTIWFSEDKVVKDIQILPELEEDEIIPAEYCQVEGKIDPFIFTIAKLDQKTFENRIVDNSQIQHAWRADPISGKINEIPLLGIECSGEGGFDPNNIIYKFSK